MGCNCGRRSVVAPGVVPAPANRRPGPSVAPVVVAPPPPPPDPLVWGPPLWRALHIAANFSDRLVVRNDWAVLIQILQNNLPCPDCTAHYKAWFAGHRFVKGNNHPDVRLRAHEWLVALHNDVNVRTEKPTMTVDEVATLFGGDRLVRIAEAEAAVASLRGIVGSSALNLLTKILRLIKRR
jgi:hypothetical protein